MNGYKIVSWFAAVTSIVLLVLPRLVPICTGLSKEGGPMRCHFAFQAEFLVVLLAVILSVALSVLRTAEARLLNGFTILLLGIIIVVLPQPWAIGICEHGGACHKTAFFAGVGGGLLTLAGAAVLWFTVKGEKAAK
jgi:hypothetical protein